MLHNVEVNIINLGRLSYGYLHLAPSENRQSNKAFHPVSYNTYNSEKYGTSFTDVSVSFRSFFHFTMNGGNGVRPISVSFGAVTYNRVREYFNGLVSPSGMSSLFNIDADGNVLSPATQEVFTMDSSYFTMNVEMRFIPTMVNLRDTTYPGFAIQLNDNVSGNQLDTTVTIDDMYRIVSAINGITPVDLMKNAATEIMLAEHNYNNKPTMRRTANDVANGQQNNGGNNTSPFNNSNSPFGNGSNRTQNQSSPFAGGSQQAPKSNPFASQQQPTQGGSPFGNGSVQGQNQSSPFAGGSQQAPKSNPFAGGSQQAPTSNPFASQQQAPAPQQPTKVVAEETNLDDAINDVFDDTPSVDDLGTNTKQETKNEETGSSLKDLASGIDMEVTEDDLFGE